MATSKKGNRILRLLFDADSRDAVKEINGLEESLEAAEQAAKDAKEKLGSVGSDVVGETKEADSAMRKLGITSSAAVRRQVEQLEEYVETVKKAAKEGKATQEDVLRAQQRLAQKTERWARLSATGVEDAFERPLDRLERRLRGVAGRIGRLGAGAAKMGGAAIAAGAVAGAAGLTATTMNALEVGQASRVSGLSVKKIQEVGFAAKSFGIEVEDIGDKLKDVNDKFSDFFETGAGPLKDFFENVGPKVGITAENFKKLDASDRLIEFVRALEASGRTLEEGSTFYLEGVVSDGTKLLDLYKDGGAELERFAKRFRELGGGFTQEDISRAQEMREGTTEVGAAFDRLGATIMGAGIGDAFDQGTDKLVKFIGMLEKGILKSAEFLNNSESAFALGFRQSALGSMFGYEAKDTDLTAIKKIRGFSTGVIGLQGPGTGTSDSILARLSAGESVITSRATNFWGPDFMHAINNMIMPPAFGAIPTAMADAGSPQRGGMVTLPIHGPDGTYEGQFDQDTAERLTRDMRKRSLTKSIRTPAFARSKKW